MDVEGAARLARAFGSDLVMAGGGSSGLLRREATDDGSPTITLELGEAHRFAREPIDHALDGVRSVFADSGSCRQDTVRWPGWRTVIEGWSEQTWLRADAGRIVERNYKRGGSPRRRDELPQQDPVQIRPSDRGGPFTGLLVGVLENPGVYPGNPRCQFIELAELQERIIESQRGTPRE